MYRQSCSPRVIWLKYNRWRKIRSFFLNFLEKIQINSFIGWNQIVSCEQYSCFWLFQALNNLEDLQQKSCVGQEPALFCQTFWTFCPSIKRRHVPLASQQGEYTYSTQREIILVIIKLWTNIFLLNGLSQVYNTPLNLINSSDRIRSVSSHKGGYMRHHPACMFVGIWTNGNSVCYSFLLRTKNKRIWP